jgi:hypothetical protein
MDNSKMIEDELAGKSDVEKVGRLLELIRENDKQYLLRELLVWRLFYQCKLLRYKCSVGTDPDCPEGWRSVRIELPCAGQFSWHTPDDEIVYDGHTTEDKYSRVDLY